MKRLAAFMLVFGSLICISFQQESNFKGSEVTSPRADLVECQFVPDTSISGVYFSDSKSTWKVLGTQWELTEEGEEWAHQPYLSNDGTQLLKVFIHDGGAKYQYDEFEIRYADSGSTVQRLSLPEFVSGNGIKLGQSLEEVTKMAGPCWTVSTTTCGVVVRYYISADESQTLKRYNQVGYSAQYYFCDNKLVRFRYGFEYP